MRSLLPPRLAAMSLATFMAKATHCSPRASANLLATAVWEPSWVNQRVLCKSDNMAVVAILNTGSAKDSLLMHLLCCLFFYAAHYHFSLSATHLPDRENFGTDALSHNKHIQFLSTYPQALPTPTAIPVAIVQLAVTSRPDWTSKSWKQLFISILNRGLPSPQSDPTGQPSSTT